MNEIVDSVRRVTDIMAEITAASQEQASGIEQVNQAVAQMDEVTQQNAALVEEAAAASQSMQEEAGNLAQIVSVFRLSGMQAAAPAKTTVRPKVPAAHGTTAMAARASRSKSAPVPAANRQAVLSNNGEEWEQF